MIVTTLFCPNRVTGGRVKKARLGGPPKAGQFWFGKSMTYQHGLGFAREPNEFPESSPQARLYASLVRALEGASVENKLTVFTLIARLGATDTAAIRQEYIDDLWWLAEQVNLVKLLGVGAVQDALASAFGG